MKNRRVAQGILLFSLAGLLTGCKTSEEKLNYNEALALYQSQAYEEAMEYYEKAVATEETAGKSEQKLNKKAYYGMGVICFEQGQYEEAMEHFEKALAIPYLEHWDVEIGAYQIDTLCVLGRYEEAQALVRKLRSENAESYELLFKEYYILEALGQKTEANECLHEGLAIKGSGAEAEFSRAKLYYFLGNEKEAEDGFKKAREEGNWEAAVYLGRLHEDREAYEEARAQYEACLDEVPDSGYVRLRLGMVEEKLGNIPEALEAYERGISGGDGSFQKELRINQMTLLEKEGRFDEAYEKCKSYLEVYEADEAMEKELAFLETRASKGKAD